MQPANTAAVSATTISSTAFNTLVTDIGTELTNSVDRGGRSAMTAALPMGNQKITGMAEPTVSTDGATKNYVDTATATFFGTGDIKLTLKTAADSGWLLFDDGTFGNAGSGSSNSNAVANLALFTLLFNNLSDTAAPILTSGGGATTRAAQTNAATAWAALCRMSLPKTLGRALAVAGTGSGLTARTLGSNVGNETSVLVTANLPPYTPAGTIVTTVTPSQNVLQNLGGNSITPPGTLQFVQTNASVTTFPAVSTFTGTAQGGTSTGVSIMQPSVFLNCMVKT